MRCPLCNLEMRISEREGIEIDYCPQCRGIWLDRGELDKIIERSATYEAPVRRKKPTHHQVYDDHYTASTKRKYRYEDDEYDDNDDYRHRKKSGKPRRKKAKDFMEEIFDIFD